MKQRKQITITIETSNSAFDDCEQGEVSRILRNVCRYFADGLPATENLPLRDINGNAVGHVVIEKLL